MKIIKYFIIAVYILCLHGASANSSCDSVIFSHEEEEKIELIGVKIDDFLFQERRDTLTIIRNFQERVKHKNMDPRKKCLAITALDVVENNTLETLSSYSNTSEYLLHPYYQNTYLPNIPEEVLQEFIFRRKTPSKEVFLTFDDGPVNKNLIDFLKQEEIAATFFLVCNKINSQNLKLYDSTLFSLGSHSYYHANYDKLTEIQIQNDIKSCDEVFKSHNIDHRIFRPAYGIINKSEAKILKNNNLLAYIWSLDSSDWAGEFNEDKVKTMLSKIQSGDIFLFHEGVDRDMLLLLISRLREQGFSFGKL